MTREEKLKQLQAKTATVQIVTDGQTVIEALATKIEELKTTFGAGVDLNVDDLVDEVAKIQSIAPAVEELKKAISELEIPDMLETVQIKGLEGIIPAIDELKGKVAEIHVPEIPDSIHVTGLDELANAIAKHVRYIQQLKEFKIPDAKVEIVDNQKISEVTERLDQVIKAIEANSPNRDQSAEDYIPVRRVRLIGNRVIFDDDAWASSAGGGGGSSSSSGGGDGTIIDGVDASIKATVKGLANTNPLMTQIVDNTGTAITSFGGGTQYTEGDTDASITGTALMLEDTSDTLRAAKGDATYGLDIDPTRPPVNYSTSGNLSSAASITTAALDGFSTVFTNISGTWSATLVFEASFDNTNWSDIYGFESPATYGVTTATPRTTTTTNRRLTFTLGGRRYFRVRASGYSSGTVVIEISASVGSPQMLTSQVLAVDESFNLRTLNMRAAADSVSASTTALDTLSLNSILSGAGTGWDRQRSVVNATNSAGTGITAVGLIAQFDDSSPTSITENQFGNLRMSANRNLYVTLRDAAGNERGLNIDSSGNITANVTGTITSQESQASSATITRVATSGTSAQLLAANSARKQAIIVNDSAVIMYLKYGATATATDYTHKLYPDDSAVIDRYTGRIDAILASGSGSAQVTEL